ncbi:GNAT family N-acetyltransferase [Bacillus sp. NEB1478]|uniref:GNAT family N-acetyltransferase n=1 Tax=Bacillus sp. NEB1478 TaxID=3073816 RepID=UPI002872F7CC|nr:GNAT family N-acetyltransferase [Bacillus sp. NEB1478]WNB91021.1 GNAT family N-acetyltransferase [Bacillus sp. NEB1478]
MDYKIEVSLEENNEFAAFLGSQIKEFNNENSFHHKESRKIGAVQPIHIIVTDENQKWLGGISARIYWNWLEIDHFWFSEQLRGKGIGQTLLKKTEEIAVKKGAVKALLSTFNFQARTFYEKYGYKVVGKIEDYPPGSTFYTMVKPLKEV